MISDAPYASGEMALKPLTGLAAGIIGAVLMLAAVGLLAPLSHLSVSHLAQLIGSSVAPAWNGDGSSTTLWKGLCIHLFTGAVGGLLYALCQQPIPGAGLAVVGVFYGFMLWIFGSLSAGLLLGEALRGTLRSWPWLLAHLAFGTWLAAAAAWSQSRRPAGSGQPMPLD